HDAPDGSRARARLLRRLLAGLSARLRIRLEARGLSVARHLGGEREPHRIALERTGVDPRHGVRRLAVPGSAAADGRARLAVRHADVSLASRPHDARRRVLRRHHDGQSHSRIDGVATMTAADRIARALNAFRIEIPSWGFANTGTRFG